MWIALNPGFTFEKGDEHLTCDICGNNVKAGEGGAYYQNSETGETIMVAGSYDNTGVHKACNRSPKLN